MCTHTLGDITLDGNIHGTLRLIGKRHCILTTSHDNVRVHVGCEQPQRGVHRHGCMRLNANVQQNASKSIHRHQIDIKRRHMRQSNIAGKPTLLETLQVPPTFIVVTTAAVTSSSSSSSMFGFSLSQPLLLLSIVSPRFFLSLPADARFRPERVPPQPPIA